MSLDPKTEAVIAQVRSDKAQAVLRRRMAGKSEKLILAKWRASGFSSAQLIGAYLTAPGERMRSVIIKISSDGRGDKEENAHRNAWNDALPQFAEAHMAQLLSDPIPVDGGEWVSFQQVAGGGFHEMAEFDKVMPDWDEPAKVCSSILGSLTGEWNTKPDGVEAPVHDLLPELLERRLQKRGSIRAWAGEIPQLLDNPRRWLRHGDGELVNPFALVSADPPEWRIPIIVDRGMSHGDLHPGNLLVGRRSTPEQPMYCLIDFSRYRKNGLLAWDPAYLLVTMVAKHLEAGAVDRYLRERLRHCLVDPTSTELALSREMRALINGITQAGIDLATKRGTLPEWRSQWLLCVTAAALILTGRSTLLSAANREWFFWLAAAAATELVRNETEHTPETPLKIDRYPLISHGEVISLDEWRREAKVEPPMTGARPAIDNPVHDDEMWVRLADELRSTRLDAGNRATLASRTEALRQLLAESRGPAPTHSSRVDRYLGELTEILSEALRPGTTEVEIRAAGSRADLLRIWLVDLMS